jgi:hypothetical protein
VIFFLFASTEATVFRAANVNMLDDSTNKSLRKDLVIKFAGINPIIGKAFEGINPTDAGL